MTDKQQFDRRLVDWLEDGPVEAPGRLVDSAVAFAYAHPRRRRLLGGPWRNIMARLQPTPFPSSEHRPRITAFASVAVVAVVAIALVGGGALLLNQGPANQPAAAPAATATPAPTPSPSANPDEALAADVAAVWSNPYDAATVAALYAPDAVVHDLVSDLTQTGIEEIGAQIRLANMQDFKVVVTSATIRQDDFVANFIQFGGGEAAYPGFIVLELKDGNILNQWVHDAASSPADSPDEALVADLLAKWSTPYDAATVAALYAPNAVFHDTVNNKTFTGLEAIQANHEAMTAVEGLKVVVTSAPIRQDNFVAHFVKFGNTSELSGRGLVVYELTDGKILNEWVYPAP